MQDFDIQIFVKLTNISINLHTSKPEILYIYFKSIYN